MIQIDILFLEMFEEFWVNPLDNLFHFGERFLDSGPRTGVVINHTFENFTE